MKSLKPFSPDSRVQTHKHTIHQGSTGPIRLNDLPLQSPFPPLSNRTAPEADQAAERPAKRVKLEQISEEDVSKLPNPCLDVCLFS